MLIRTLLVASLVASLALPSGAQTAFPVPNKGSWERVEKLHPGTLLYVDATDQYLHCTFQSADANTLSCLGKHGGVIFQRSGIKTVKRARRLRSTLSATGMGVVAGAILGASTLDKSPGEELALTVAAGAIIVAGPFIGFFTDLTRSTVYEVN